MTQCDESIYRQMRRPTIYILCAIPGAGKTTYALNTLVPMVPDVVYISSDDIRAEICEDVQDQSRNFEVFEEFYRRARKAIKERRNVILDATHLTKRNRRRCRERFEDLDCKFIAVQLNTSIDEAMRRNRERDRVVPNHAMIRMINSYQPVGKDEGFDEIWRIDS